MTRIPIGGVGIGSLSLINSHIFVDPSHLLIEGFPV